MEEIIQPIEREKIRAELTHDKFLRNTSFGSCELYTINNSNSPNIMLEIGRLREIAFRQAGGGTGKAVDLDEFDTDTRYEYQQLIVWEPASEAILGGYRYVLCRDMQDAAGNYHLATDELFDFSEKFKTEYLPSVIELGRSFVHHEYQSGEKKRKGIFVLDNLWEGLGAVVAQNPDIKYLFGKVTMYLQFPKLGRDYILYFMKKHFGDTGQLVLPKMPLPFHYPEEELAAVFTGETMEEDYKILFRKVREEHHNIPPLISSYIGLSTTMKSFGTALNSHFGDVEETGILVTISEIEPKKLERYVYSFVKIM
ncbi:MAG: GNAT family N-acetyltransferase [Bacteroidetes bacterium]|nr:GNAT family N-acetyltransferase [Bacteroidota bacterium]